MRRHAFFLFVVASLVLGAGIAAAEPWPIDEPQTQGTDPQEILQTPLFLPGEVDLSTLGVNPTELLTVGPQVSLLSGGGALIVDDDGLDCPNAQYLTIQSAVNAAMSGDKIKVCRGTYIEQVRIPAGKDDLTLFSEGAWQAIIKAPPLMTAPEAIVDVNGAQNTTIRHFTITGPGGGGCNSIRYGVFVRSGGSALITDNHITQIRDLGPMLSGCQNGIGVSVGRALAPDGPTTGSATVVHNLIDRYQKGGILVDNSGSSAEVAFNEIVGEGPTVFNAQNGIQVSRRAVVDVHHNKVSQNFYSPAGTTATGMLLFDDPNVRAHHNDLFMNEVAVGLSMVFGTAEVSYNSARSNFDGIVAFSNSSGNLITHNKAFQNSRFDCRDDTVGPSNQWVKNLGRTQNQPGLCKQAGPQ